MPVYRDLELSGSRIMSDMQDLVIRFIDLLSPRGPGLLISSPVACAVVMMWDVQTCLEIPAACKIHQPCSLVVSAASQV